MTGSASAFITPLSLAALTGEKTYTDLFSLTDEAEMGHIQLARQTDLVLVVPATANLMARTANGLADDLATTILLATAAPVMMAPAMNQAMWGHPATQANHTTLVARGIGIIGHQESRATPLPLRWRRAGRRLPLSAVQSPCRSPRMSPISLLKAPAK